MCFIDDYDHWNHKFILIDRFMKDNNHDELSRLFGQTYNQMIKDIESLIESFDNRLNKYLDEREEQIRTSVEMMISDYRLLIMKWKQ